MAYFECVWCKVTELYLDHIGTDQYCCAPHCYGATELCDNIEEIIDKNVLLTVSVFFQALEFKNHILQYSGFVWHESDVCIFPHHNKMSIFSM